MGVVLQRGLDRLRSLSCIGDVRGRGLLAGIEFVQDKNTGRPFPPSVRFAESFATTALELGLVVWPNAGQLDDGSGDLAMVAPPFIIEDDQIGDMVTLLAEAAQRTASQVEAGR
jgi:adenosylmethionine-8-amino-7-oxononanoate aminotransferase